MPSPREPRASVSPVSLAELPPSEFMQVADSTWLVLSVVSNGRAPSGCQATGVTKIARSVIAPLAEHHVSVLMLSTYQTDFILVSECWARTGTLAPGPTELRGDPRCPRGAAGRGDGARSCPPLARYGSGTCRW